MSEHEPCDSSISLDSRRQFIATVCAITAAAGVTSPAWSQQQSGNETDDDETPSDEADDRNITLQSVAEAEKMVGAWFTDAERKQILKTVEDQLALFESRADFDFANGLGMGQTFNPRLPGMSFDHLETRFVRSNIEPGSVPSDDADIAFAPVTHLSRWIERKELTSTRLTKLYLDRLNRIGSKLECVVTLTADMALKQARQADQEIAAGRYRGPLHGIPWGAKDLLDTKGISTTWGATPYKDRIGESDATVFNRLTEAGAVLVAKLTLGALAYGDIWFGGKTRTPWDTSRGSSGSSAGPAAATAAGLVGFSIGTETYGSIVSPCMRCGSTGLRPTFGRVARTGAMALSWSFDKIGPICRTVEDCALVLNEIHGSDSGDPSSVDMPLMFDAGRDVSNLRVGINPKWFQGRRANEIDRKAAETARELGMKIIDIELPDWPYNILQTILIVEAAAAFEQLTLSDRDDELVWQDNDAWPNTFRLSRFTPAIEYVQAERFRRKCMNMLAKVYEDVDVILSPSFANPMLLTTNATGHPSLTIRAGFSEQGMPRGVTLWGRLYDEGTLCRAGMALEQALGVWVKRPKTG